MSFIRRRVLKVVFFAVLAFIIFELPNSVLRYWHPAEPEKVEKQPQYFHPLSVNFTHVPPPPERKPTQVLGKHKYRQDGLLEVNEEGQHPIYELIARAEKEWERKLSRASKTLAEAVREYKRRYNRYPPKGFDLWWNYATKHNVKLPDEYDQIYHDLELFWGLEPADLIKIHEESELKKDSYTIGKNETDGDIDVLTYAFQDGRYNQLIVGSREIIKMFRQIQNDLPLFRMTISPHDGPNRLSDWAIRQAALDAAAGGTYIERAALPKRKRIGWVSACHPDSPSRRKTIDLDVPPPPRRKKTFIHDHVKTMDPCEHPNLLYHHGQFLSHNKGPDPQEAVVPEFSACSTTIHHNVRLPTPYGWVEDIPRDSDPEFDDKVDERLLWRGSNTGMFHASKTRWHHSHRDYMVYMANDLEGTIKIIPPNRAKNEKIGPFKELRKAHVNPATMDIAFAGAPIACSESTCPILEELYPWRDRMSVAEAGEYKYVLDVDGNGWSGRFKRLITSNSLIFKSTIYPEWFADRVQPWVHYVPVQIDLSDLHDALIFFRGDGNGEGAHEALARKIAISGRQWSKTFWRKEDLISYLFRLTLEYARLMSEDREAMTYHEARD